MPGALSCGLPFLSRAARLKERSEGAVRAQVAGAGILNEEAAFLERRECLKIYEDPSCLESKPARRPCALKLLPFSPGANLGHNGCVRTRSIDAREPGQILTFPVEAACTALAFQAFRDQLPGLGV